MAKLYAESEVRQALRKALNHGTQTALAREAGVSKQVVFMAINGAPITGKLLAHLGYERIKEKLYRKRSI